MTTDRGSRSRRLAAIAVALAATLPSAAAAAGVAPAPRDVVATAASAAALPAGAHFESELSPGLRMYRLAVPAGISAAAYAQQLAQAPDVFAAQPNTVLRGAGLASVCSEAPTETSLFLPGALKALEKAVVTDPIAILDTGVSDAAPELGVRVRPGYNASAGTEDTSDLDGHGTEVAAAAAGDAASGRVGGVSPKSPILPITIFNSAGDTTVDWVVKGISEAAKRGAGVINLSSSAFVSDAKSGEVQVFQQAIDAAFNRGVITVGAIGNENRGDPVMPGSLPHVITVGSASLGGTRDAFSNFGPWLDLVAPGANLVLPAPPEVCLSGYGEASGTSFAAPAVSGGIALIRAAQPKLGISQVFDLVRRLSSTPFVVGDIGRDDNTGFGLLDVSAGTSATATANEPRELDDDVFWLKQDPKTHPTYLRSGRSTRVTGAVSAGKDPQDVVPVRLKRGETLTATASSKTDNVLMEVSAWSPSTGSFDIGKGATRGFLTDSGGLSPNPRTVFQAKRTGTYYIAVAAPDLASAGDTQVSNITLAPRMPYSLTLTKTKATAIKGTTKKKKKKK